MFYVAYRTLLVMFCVLKFYFVDFYGMFTSSPTWRLKMHVLCKVRKNITFQKKTLLLLLVMFYRHNKTFWYQFCNFKHFLKAENSEDSLASSCVELSIGLSCNPVWLDWVTVGTTCSPPPPRGLSLQTSLRQEYHIGILVSETIVELWATGTRKKYSCPMFWYH